MAVHFSNTFIDQVSIVKSFLCHDKTSQLYTSQLVIIISYMEFYVTACCTVCHDYHAVCSIHICHLPFQFAVSSTYFKLLKNYISYHIRRNFGEFTAKTLPVELKFGKFVIWSQVLCGSVLSIYFCSGAEKAMQGQQLSKILLVHSWSTVLQNTCCAK